MKAVLYNPKLLSWNTSVIEEQEIKAGQAKVKVLYAGLCGSDMHRINAPGEIQSRIPLGHEIVGTVLSSSEEKELIGKTVVINPIINCGICEPCSNLNSQFCQNISSIGKTEQGGFSEVLNVPTKQLYMLPEGMNIKNGVLVDGLAVVVNAHKKLSSNILESALVIGDGTIGALTLAGLRALHPNISLYISGRNSKNIEKLCSNYDAIPYKEEQSDFDVCFETVGRGQSDTLNLSINKTKIGGDILVLGVYPEGFELELDARAAFYKELKITGVNSFVTGEERDDFSEALELISKNNSLFDPIITHEMPLDCFSDGIHLMTNKVKSGAMKVIFCP